MAVKMTAPNGVEVTAAEEAADALAAVGFRREEQPKKAAPRKRTAAKAKE